MEQRREICRAAPRPRAKCILQRRAGPCRAKRLYGGRTCVFPVGVRRTTFQRSNSQARQGSLQHGDYGARLLLNPVGVCVVLWDWNPRVPAGVATLGSATADLRLWCSTHSTYGVTLDQTCALANSSSK